MNPQTKDTIFQRLNNLFTGDSNRVPLGAILGLVLLYIFSYPVLALVFGPDSVHLMIIPVILAAWIYGIRGGVIAGVLGLFINVTLSWTRLGWNSWFLWAGSDLLEGCFLIGVGWVVGYLREKLRDYAQIERKLRAREKHLALLNQMTQTILSGRDLDSRLKALVDTITKLFNADDCYITRWDPIQGRVVPVITSASLERPYVTFEYTQDEKNMTQSVLDAGQVLFAEDTRNTPYIGPKTASLFPAVSLLGVPLIFGQYKLGAVLIAFNTRHQITSEELELAEQSGAQIALALWNIQQDEKIGRQLKETDALVKIGRALSKTERTGTSTVLQLIVDSARELIPRAEQSVIHLLDQEENLLISYAASGFSDNLPGKSGMKMPLGSGVAGQVIQKGEAINIPDVHDDPRFLSAVLPPFRSLLVAPIQSGEEQIGTISVQSNSIHAFSSEEVELLKALGAQAAVAIENTQLYEVTEQRLKEMDVLYHISRDTGISFDPGQMFKEVAKLLKQKFKYYKVQIFLLNPSDNQKVDFHSSDEDHTEMPEIYQRLDAYASIAGHVARTGEPFLTNDVNQVLFFAQDASHTNIQSELAVPIKIEGQVVGVLDIQHTPPYKLENWDLRLVIAIANQLAINIHEANLYINLQESLKQEQAMRAQLIQSERLALVGRLLASVSHELNNPLQAIQNALFLIKDEIGLSSQGRQDMDIILSETDRMSTLIERLRLVYKPVRGKDFQPLQINTLVEDISLLISAHMRRKEIKFEFQADPNLALVPGIPDQLIQVLLNIFLNAVEAMPSQGRLFVKTQTLSDEGEIMITIKDTGPGIAPEVLPNIFNPFVTSKDNGTGLGLAISHDIVEQHAGRIEATNDPQGGAVFTIWLPISQKEFS